MTTLITGAGLIGRLTAEMLVERGETVVLVDVRETDLVCAARLDFEVCDITDATRLSYICERHQVRRIVHTAAMLSTAIRRDPARGIQVNVLGTVNVLEAARRHNLGRVICASSTTVGYAGFAAHGAQPIDEDIPLHIVSERPASIYAATKLAGEHLALLYREQFRLDVLVLRYAAVLGGTEPPTSVPGRLLAALIEGGRTGNTVVLNDPFLLWGGREEFVDARDCARANVCALDAPDPPQGVYNIAPGSWFTIEEFISTVRRVHPRLHAEWPTDIRTGFAGFPHVRPAPSSVEAARRELGFRCVFSLEDTVRAWDGATPAKAL
jgi:UDP-glucose 4-epimerase